MTESVGIVPGIFGYMLGAVRALADPGVRDRLSADSLERRGGETHERGRHGATCPADEGPVLKAIRLAALVGVTFSIRLDPRR